MAAPREPPTAAPVGASGAAGLGDGGARELSAEELEAMLEELVAAYRGPALQADFQALRAACERNRTNPLLFMGPMVLKVQAPILNRYGHPPSARGVELMKHAVERRVAEGSQAVEALANEARGILGIAPMPNRTATAEQVLSAKVDETDARLGLAAGAPDSRRPELGGELGRQCLMRVAADRAAGLLPEASASYLELLLTRAEAPVPSVLSLHKMAKLGIAASGLRGADLHSAVPTLADPKVEVFFRSHVLPNRPVVIQGAFNAEDFPPLQQFPDAEFLRRRCGHRRVLVKSLAHADAVGRPVFVSDPELKLPMGAFLDSVEAHESNGSRPPFYLGKVPLRRELPELADDIERAPTCPRRRYGNCFGDLVSEGVFTYFGCGRNTTPVHWDAHENLLLCLCGTKRLLLYPPSDARFLYPCNDFSRSAVVPFARFDDLNVELQAKFALVKGAGPLEVSLGAGDLLYLPSCWWHCVEGSEERNMILNWWFALRPDKKARAFDPSSAAPAAASVGAAAA